MWCDFGVALALVVAAVICHAAYGGAPGSGLATFVLGALGIAAALRGFLLLLALDAAETRRNLAASRAGLDPDEQS